MFHPLAYMVKLNIEMSMAHLIKTIALGSGNADNVSFLLSYDSKTEDGLSGSSGMFGESQERRQSLFRGLFGRNLHHNTVALPERPVNALVRSRPSDEQHGTITVCAGGPHAAESVTRAGQRARQQNVHSGREIFDK